MRTVWRPMTSAHTERMAGSGMRKLLLGALDVAASLALVAGCGSPLPSPSGRGQVYVASCPVPASDYSGLGYPPQLAPRTIRLKLSLTPPGNAQIFATTFLPRSTSYLVAPKSATCRAYLSSADLGEVMAATSGSDHSENVTMTVHAGGLGPSTDLACPYIPAVLAVDKVFRQGQVFCDHPSADVIRQIPTDTPGLYAAAVFAPAHVQDPNIQGSGGPNATVALYTAAVGQGAAIGQTIACTLPPADRDICAGSLRFWLATQAQIRTRISAANLSKMEDALSSFLAEEHI
jgi:hypothetical protein